MKEKDFVLPQACVACHWQEGGQCFCREIANVLTDATGKYPILGQNIERDFFIYKCCGKHYHAKVKQE